MSGGLLAAVVLSALLGVYVFWPQRRLAQATETTRLDYLEERKTAVYDNLRDLRFEFQAGKYPEEDYQAQRRALEDEASHILAEMDMLSGRTR